MVEERSLRSEQLSEERGCSAADLGPPPRGGPSGSAFGTASPVGVRQAHSPGLEAQLATIKSTHRTRRDTTMRAHRN